MRSVSYRIEDFDSNKKIIIPIGFVGENEFTIVNINCHSIFKDHPNAVVTSVVTPPKGDEYPGTVNRDGDIVKWIPTASDLVYDGYGEIQLTFTDGEKIGKTYSARTHIEPSAAGSGEVPTPIQTWIEQANEKLADVESAVQAAEDAAEEIDGMTVEASGTAYGTSPTAEVTDVEGHKHIAFTIPAGQPGPNGHDGQPGQDGHTPVKGTDYWTAQDKQEMVGDVVDEMIDDEAGEGDTNKVVSADKYAKDQTQLLNQIDGKYTKPVDGIPGSDLEYGVIPVVHNVPSGGTTGQALVKSSNADYDAEWGTVAQPTDQQVEDAVDSYLDAHPEATTTVQDGAITVPKLEAGLKNDIIIEQESEQAYFQNVSPLSVTFYPEEKVPSEPCRYVGSPNLVENKYNTGTQAGFTKTKSGRFMMIKGTGDSSGVRFLNFSDSASLNKLKGKTVNIYLYIKKSTNWEKASRLIFYDGKSSLIYENFSANSNKFIGFNVFANLTISASANTIMFKIDESQNDVFADGDFVWVGIYETSAVNTEHVFDQDESYTINPSGLNYVDTMMHKSTVTFITPTKQYIDNHIPDIEGFWTEKIYALPEYFGAVGNGVADDTQAILDCIAYAEQTGKPIRGFGKYKVTSTILLKTQYLDVYLRHIVYSGNDSAVQLSSKDIRFEFHTIDSDNVGISHDRYNNELCARHKVIGNAINSDGDCIQIFGNTYYSSFDIKYLNSENSNCIKFISNGVALGECSFFNCSCRCPNGAAVYSPSASKFYNFTVESNCLTGIVNGNQNVFIGWRHREQADTIASKVVGNRDTADALFKFTSKYDHQMIYDCPDYIYWFSIDTSQSGGYDDYEGQTDYWTRACSIGEIRCGVKGSGILSGVNAKETIASKVYILCGNKIFVPDGRKIVHVTAATYDYRLFESMADEDILAAKNIRWGTDYIIDTEHTDIYLTASHCAIGYNHLTVTQENGNNATIYDKLGNVLFDGETLGDGVYELVCKQDPTSSGRWGGTGSPIWWAYDGTNEKWEITKLN